MRIRKFSTQKTRFRGEIAQNIETWYTMGKFMPGRRISNWYYVYVLQSLKDGEFYVGYTANLAGRIAEHNTQKNRSTKSRTPLRLIYAEACIAEEDARRRERYLKTTQGRRMLKLRLRKFLNS
jgi:putative endonuclease